MKKAIATNVSNTSIGDMVGFLSQEISAYNLTNSTTTESSSAISPVTIGLIIAGGMLVLCAKILMHSDQPSFNTNQQNRDASPAEQSTQERQSFVPTSDVGRINYGFST